MIIISPWWKSAKATSFDVFKKKLYCSEQLSAPTLFGKIKQQIKCMCIYGLTTLNEPKSKGVATD